MFTALYDSCVLYPAPLRDLLMHLALVDVVRARWTRRIHEEWIGKLLENRPDLTLRQLVRTRDLMDQHVLDCVIEGYESLIDGLKLPDPDDRHVLAAAIHGGADVSVTFNLEDFPALGLHPHNIKAQHPDEFIVRLLDRNAPAVCLAAKRHRGSLRNPSISREQYLQTLERQRLGKTAARLREFAASI